MLLLYKLIMINSYHGKVNKYEKIKRGVALTAVILWGVLIIVTLITAFIDTQTARTLLKGLYLQTIVFPIVIYAMMLVYRYLSKGNSRQC